MLRAVASTARDACLVGSVVYGLGFLTLMILVLSDQNGVLELLNSTDCFWTQDIEQGLPCLCWDANTCLEQTDVDTCVNEPAADGHPECCGYGLDPLFLDNRTLLAVIFGLAAAVMFTIMNIRKEKEAPYPSFLDS
jgi:hypothetical protein